jgi:Asp-tRNA(Asn)/Glu-tRNA(Gln) amidotransferase A subunit family amidase
MHRIPDWDTLDTAARGRRQEHARPQATALDPILNAFAQIDATPFPPSAAGPLGGLPYAAKDLFQTPTHRPGGGFAEGVDLEIIGTSDLLERLDANGADLIGFTNMTEWR